MTFSRDYIRKDAFLFDATSNALESQNNPNRNDAIGHNKVQTKQSYINLKQTSMIEERDDKSISKNVNENLTHAQSESTMNKTIQMQKIQQELSIQTEMIKEELHLVSRWAIKDDNIHVLREGCQYTVSELQEKAINLCCGNQTDGQEYRTGDVEKESEPKSIKVLQEKRDIPESIKVLQDKRDIVCTYKSIRRLNDTARRRHVRKNAVLLIY
eukprot:CAMPEP_0194296472 /NCGR_PEP_ID=MMETSP0169-20130528/56202_1 /TAXON_ID=218684 /ORGANISM="Corethron pennatum, Strain L29A3" /LENGTH=212 /DNA_ID=CAMNT_0039045953 /DNA_START=291 /DNA_END=929 /DNA_ORIENTATION=-